MIRETIPLRPGDDVTIIEATPLAPGSSDAVTALFAADQASSFRSRWHDIQSSFVDEPRNAVEQADGLVSDVFKRLSDTLAEERGKLERDWASGGNASTEDLRQVLRRYRAFFDRLLAV